MEKIETTPELRPAWSYGPLAGSPGQTRKQRQDVRDAFIHGMIVGAVAVAFIVDAYVTWGLK